MRSSKSKHNAKQEEDEDEEDEINDRKVKEKMSAQTYTPHLFNFDHYYDPELTPRKPW